MSEFIKKLAVADGFDTEASRRLFFWKFFSMEGVGGGGERGGVKKKMAKIKNKILFFMASFSFFCSESNAKV